MTHWLQAARIRTLPLSLSGIIMGSLLAFSTHVFDFGLFFLALLTASLLQILSNFANDYGDGIRGTDKNKKGETRMVASGLISHQKMKIAIGLLVFLSLISGIFLLWKAFGIDYLGYLLLFLVLGAGAVLAAIYYTMGKNPYGYKGWGDFFVFLFFGWIGVLGAYFLQTKEISFLLLLPASAIGLLSAAVLNLNNLRDYETDKIANKKTMVIILGITKAKIYHTVLLIFPFVFMVIFLFISNHIEPKNFVFLILLIPILIHLKKVWQTKDTAFLDGELKKIGILTFVFTLFSTLPLVL
ncbi:MAG TPA: 1,4-dihydroxy-2-naphthoate octaprenyltransferase [Flavobacterium sp.]|nr:1,4-dihydroxy-2-naphthoate octaprenyltransferase [Flavobacterium sp.]